MTIAQSGKPAILPDPFSAQGFCARAMQFGLPLDQASWMADQDLGYGIDAGHVVDTEGRLIDKKRLDRIVPRDAWKMSAVLIPVVARDPEVTVILTLRTSHLSAHSGQIAFPGGKVEATDATPVDAALREASEEIGLLSSQVTPLSLLDLHKTGTGYRIIPVLGLVDPSFIPQPDVNEVAEVFEVPLSFLMAERNHLPHIGQWKGQRILFHSMTYEDRFIWGATAAVIRNLYDRLYNQSASASR